jgi:hypothetical protein
MLREHWVVCKQPGSVVGESAELSFWTVSQGSAVHEVCLRKNDAVGFAKVYSARDQVPYWVEQAGSYVMAQVRPKARLRPPAPEAMQPRRREESRGAAHSKLPRIAKGTQNTGGRTDRSRRRGS